MATFPPAFLDELRERLTLSEVIGKRIKLTRAGREFKGCCPFHNEKTPSFYVNDDKKFFHCFGCGAHGDVIGFMMRHDGQSFPEAVESLAPQAGLSVPKDTPVEREQYDKQKRLLQLLDRATAFFEDQLHTPAGREARAYFQKRGLSDEAQRRFRLGFAPMDAQLLIRSLQGQGYTLPEMLAVGLVKKAEDRPDHYSFFRNRVMFPVCDRRGQPVAFGGRVMGEGEPKYLNSPDHDLFHKGKLLYGLSRARAASAQGQPLIVVEGYMDVIALAEAGYIGAVAPLGTALTEDQLALLWRMLPPADARDPARDYSPILCFDGDNAGLRAAARAVDRALPLLTATQTARVAYLPSGEDPDSLLHTSGRSAVQNILDQAKPMVDVIWDLALAGRRLQTPEDRATAQRALRQKVAGIRDETLRALYQDDIEKRLATLFNWNAPKAQNNTPRRNWESNKQSGRTNHPSRFASPPLALPRRQPANALRLREKVLLAIMVNHPSLFNEFGEELGNIGFTSPDLEALRQQLIDLFASDSHETLDVEALYRHFSGGDAANGGHRGLAEVLSEATYMHAGFARPDRPLEQARQGWNSIWNKYLQGQLQADVQAANRLWHEDPSDANLTRLMTLRQQMESLVRKSSEEDADSSETAHSENE
ncbi:MAG: DNA primase [Alphaproteobacteria bacterium]|nr:DNA primase [Alphaproteobacteria bacterium]